MHTSKHPGLVLQEFFFHGGGFDFEDPHASTFEAAGEESSAGMEADSEREVLWGEELELFLEVLGTPDAQGSVAGGSEQHAGDRVHVEGQHRGGVGAKQSAVGVAAHVQGA